MSERTNERILKSAAYVESATPEYVTCTRGTKLQKRIAYVCTRPAVCLVQRIRCRRTRRHAYDKFIPLARVLRANIELAQRSRETASMRRNRVSRGHISIAKLYRSSRFHIANRRNYHRFSVAKQTSGCESDNFVYNR